MIETVKPLQDAFERARTAWSEDRNLTAATVESYVKEAQIVKEAWLDPFDVKPLKYRLSRLQMSTAAVVYSRWQVFSQFMPLEFRESLKLIPKPKVRRKSIRYLTKEQDEALFRKCREDSERVLLFLGMKMGLRIGDIMSIDFEDFTVNGHDFWVRVIRKGGHEQQLRCPKQFNKVFLRFSEGLSKRGQLFPFTRRWVQKMIEKLGERAKLPFRLTPHVLRHTFATQMAMAGADLIMLKNLMGHSSINSTMKYVHFTDEHLEKAKRLQDQISTSSSKLT